MIAAAIHPSVEGDSFSDVFASQFAAVVSSHGWGFVD